MKKLFVVLCIGVVAFAFTSCKKDCKCTGEYGVTGVVMVPVDVTYPDVKSSDCKKDLFQLPAGYVLPEGGVIDIKCESK